MPHQENKNATLGYTMSFTRKFDLGRTDVTQGLIHKAMSQTDHGLYILLWLSLWSGFKETAHPE